MTRPTTRREFLEHALVAERINLWGDLTRALDSAKREGRSPHEDPLLSLLVERIRAATWALGYPSDPSTIATRSLLWYQFVESSAALGMCARPLDEDWLATVPDVHRVTKEDRKFLRWEAPETEPWRPE